MTYNDIIKKLESVGIEIDYTVINEKNLNAICQDVNEFESRIKK